MEFFGIFYDVVEFVGYMFDDGSEKLFVVIDFGYMSDKVCDVIVDFDVFVLEVNYDVELLCMGWYLWNIKCCILSDIGYLLNEVVGVVFSELMNGCIKCMYLVYFSWDYNMMDFVKMMVCEVMESWGCFYKDNEFKFCDMYYDWFMLWDRVGEL